MCYKRLSESPILISCTLLLVIIALAIYVPYSLSFITMHNPDTLKFEKVNISKFENEISNKRVFTSTYYNKKFVCDNEITQSIDLKTLREGIIKRFDWGINLNPLWTLDNLYNDHMTKGIAGNSKFSEQFKGRPGLSFAALSDFGGMEYGKYRFQMLGPTVVNCNKTKTFGRGDESKIFCWDKSYDENENSCIVYSIGSNNQFGFEEDLLTNTKCKVHIFDCTVKYPKPPTIYGNRLIYHNLCIANDTFTDKNTGYRFTDLAGLVNDSNGDIPTFIKMDIEGFEWDVLPSIIISARKQWEMTGIDILPSQIAVEIHFLSQMKELKWSSRSKNGGEILALSNVLFYGGGYALAVDRPNKFCPHCDEVLFVKVACSE